MNLLKIVKYPGRYDKTWKEIIHSSKFCLQYWEAHCYIHSLIGCSNKYPSNCFLLNMKALFPKPKDLGKKHGLWTVSNAPDSDDDDDRELIKLLNVDVPRKQYDLNYVI